VKLKKYDLCKVCRKIRPRMNDGTLNDNSIEELLDSKRYNEPSLKFIMMNQMILSYLERNGGCSGCISLLRRATQSVTYTTPPDILAAVRKKAESGDEEAMLNMVSKLSFAGDPDKEEEYDREINYWIEKAANLGNAEAQFELSGVYLVEKNDKSKGFEWLEKSARNGYTKAKYYLSTDLLSMHNNDKAFFWMEQASNEGYADAKRELGFFYFIGIGVSVDEDKGLSLILEAAALGDEKAKEILRKAKGGR
jgi:hypothetical protein